MSSQTILNVEMNRVEGDLQVRAVLKDGVVADAWCAGTMFRGIERVLAGRGALDGLVVTPRICGICTTAHLYAAASALDSVFGVAPPPNAVRARNLALMSEHVQSDVRHAVLMFAADFCNPAFKDRPLYDEAVTRYEPLKGRVVLETIRETKKVLEIVAIIGGQWPHSSFMVPGGVTSVPNGSDLQKCRFMLDHYREWYERRILGCTIERWMENRDAAELQTWIEEKRDHHDSEVGFFLRYGRSIGLDKTGKGRSAYLSAGSLPIPEGSGVTAPGGGSMLVPGGFVHDGARADFVEQKIAEHVAHSWYVDYGGGRHPSEGETNPYASGEEGAKYSWAKAPRYDGVPAETGPLAEVLAAGDPLFADLVARQGSTALVRELARLTRPTRLLPAMRTWLSEVHGGGPFYTPRQPVTDGQGCGVLHAGRGILGHWLTVKDGRIDRYQIITPTAWNASPRDSAGVRGPIEEALVGTQVRDQSNPVELGLVVRSFDCCLVCTVHAIDAGRGTAAVTRC